MKHKRDKWVRACLCGAPTYRNVSPELGHVVVVAAQELGEPADRALAAFVHRFIPLKVLIVLVDRVVGQMHVELALGRQGTDKRKGSSCSRVQPSTFE